MAENLQGHDAPAAVPSPSAPQADDAWAGAALAGTAGGEPGRAMSLTQERWLAKSRWARFGLCVLPLVGACLALEVLSYCVLVTLDEPNQVGAAIGLFVIMVAVLPAALAAGLLTAAILAWTDSRHGVGFTILGALGGAVIVIAVPLASDVLS